MDDKDPQLALAVLLLYSCLILPGELGQLKIGDFNFDEWAIRLRSEISKKPETVAVPNAIIDHIKAHRLDEFVETLYVFGNGDVPGEKPIGQNELANRHRNALKATGIFNEYKFYSWMHTGAVACVKAGVSMKELQNQLRHGSLDQVDRYLQSIGIKDMNNLRLKFPSV